MSVKNKITNFLNKSLETKRGILILSTITLLLGLGLVAFLIWLVNFLMYVIIVLTPTL